MVRSLVALLPRVRSLVFAVVLATALLAQSGASGAAAETEITLYDVVGEPAAYLAVEDDLTIYLWGGEPVGYLELNGERDFHVYAFNGQHLGWFDRGVIRDHNGDVVGAWRPPRGVSAHLESLKGLKGLTPLRGLQKLPPLRPLNSLYWSEVPLTAWFAISQHLPAVAGTDPGEMMAATIIGDFEGYELDRVFVLDNGQVWRQTEAWYWYWYAYRPTAVIYSTSIGWKLHVEGIEHDVLVERIR